MKERGEKRKAERETFKKKLLSAQKKEGPPKTFEGEEFLHQSGSVAIMAVEDGKIVEINKMVERELGIPLRRCRPPIHRFFDPDSREAVE